MSIIDYIIIDPVNHTTYFSEESIPPIVLDNPNINLIRQCKDSKYVYVPGRGCVERCFIQGEDQTSSVLNEVSVSSYDVFDTALINTNTISLIPYNPEFVHGRSDFSTYPLKDDLKSFIDKKFKGEDLQGGNAGSYQIPEQSFQYAAAFTVFYQFMTGLVVQNPATIDEIKIIRRVIRLRMSFLAFEWFASLMPTLGLSEDAQRVWQNYLSASGNTLQINLQKLYEDDPKYNQTLDIIKKQYEKAIKILHSSNPNIATEVGPGVSAFTLFSKQLFPVRGASDNSAKIVLGAHLLRTNCRVFWNKNTETYSCTLYLETEDKWDANYGATQIFTIPSDTVPFAGVNFDLKSRLPSIVNLMDWSWEPASGDKIFTSIDQTGNQLLVQDRVFGVFETFEMAKPFLVSGSFSTEFTFKGSNKYERSECCPIPPEYSEYNPETKECECSFSDENETYNKYQLVRNYIYADPGQIDVSSVTKTSKFFPNKNKADVPIISYCDCPGDLVFKFENATPSQLAENPDKSFYLYCVCPSGMIPDSENDTKCVCEGGESTKELCESEGYQDYAGGKPVNYLKKYDIFINTEGDEFFPFDYNKLKPGCECVCYEDYEYDEYSQMCECIKIVKYFPNADPAAIEHKQFHLFERNAFSEESPLITVDGKCACPPPTDATIIDDTVLDCKCKKSNTFYIPPGIASPPGCICLPGLIEDPDTEECVCEEDGYIYDYFSNLCVPPPSNPSSSSSSDSESSSSSS
jgi:hypothetical protein